MLDVTIFDGTGKRVTFKDDDSVDYVSLFCPETYGPPALIAPSRASGGAVNARAAVGDRVLYINTNLVPYFEIERVD